MCLKICFENAKCDLISNMCCFPSDCYVLFQRAGESEAFYLDIIVQEGMVRKRSDDVHTITCNYEKKKIEGTEHNSDEG